MTNHIPPESLATVDLDSARAFIELCLEPEPTERPSARELLEHKFLKVCGDCVGFCGVCLWKEGWQPVLRADAHPPNKPKPTKQQK